MDNVIEAIRAALGPGANANEREAGVTACRAVLATLEATAGQPMHRAAAPAASSQIATVIGALRNVPIDQLLDLIIAKLRTALPADASKPSRPDVRFRLPGRVDNAGKEPGP
jgi:hypothetical protein